MRSRISVGALGEDIAAAYLQLRECVVLDRNWRCTDGEIDLLIADGAFRAAVEVKTRRGRSHGHPFEAITSEKARRLRSLAQRWAREHGLPLRVIRVDAVAVSIDGDSASIEYLRDVNA